MDVDLLYIEECPSWALAEGRLRRALDVLGHVDVPVAHVLVGTEAQARELDFRGCPTLRVDGVDLFAECAPDRVGVTCREYPGPAGPSGAPTVEQLIVALRRRS